MRSHTAGLIFFWDSRGQRSDKLLVSRSSNDLKYPLVVAYMVFYRGYSFIDFSRVKYKVMSNDYIRRKVRVLLNHHESYSGDYEY